MYYIFNTPVPSVNCCDGLDRCILYCILFVFMLVLLCFGVATEFSVNKDLYKVVQFGAAFSIHVVTAVLWRVKPCS